MPASSFSAENKKNPAFQLVKSKWSGQRGSNPRQSRWQRGALPLSYARILQNFEHAFSVHAFNLPHFMIFSRRKCEKSQFFCFFRGCSVKQNHLSHGCGVCEKTDDPPHREWWSSGKNSNSQGGKVWKKTKNWAYLLWLRS